MKGVTQRRRMEYNADMRIAHATASLTRAKDLPDVDSLYIEVDEEKARDVSQLTDPDEGLAAWAHFIQATQNKTEK